MDWLEVIYREEGERLFQLAWLILRDQTLAEDALHTGFLKLAQCEACPANTVGFARTTIRNSAIDLARRRSKSPTESDCDAVVIEPVSTNEIGLIVEEMLSKLSNSQREVVEYRLRLGMSFKEIAELLGEPLSTVSSRYQRTIEFLQKENGVHDE